MNKAELQQAMALAKNPKNDLSQEDINLFSGYGLSDFQRVHVSLRQVARLIRWQAQFMDGTWDAEEINQIADRGRKFFMIIGW